MLSLNWVCSYFFYYGWVVVDNPNDNKSEFIKNEPNFTSDYKRSP